MFCEFDNAERGYVWVRRLLYTLCTYLIGPFMFSDHGTTIICYLDIEETLCHSTI